MMTALKHARLARGLLLKQAAEILETDPGNLSRIEKGKQRPGLSLARRLAAMYGLSLEDVFSNPAHASTPRRRATDQPAPEQAA